MATKDENPSDTRDALDILEAEGKEWEKVQVLGTRAGVTKS